MRFIFAFVALILFFACSNARNKKIGYSKEYEMQTPNYDSLIHPLLEIGSYYTYELNKDSLAGLLLAGIQKEGDSVYYSFILSGKFFSANPTDDEYRKPGLCGSEIPMYGTNDVQKAFSKYSATEWVIKAELKKFKPIGKINLSKNNVYGNRSQLRIESLKDEFKLIKTTDEQIEKEMKGTGFPFPKSSVIAWEHLMTTNDPGEIVKPEVIWVLSAKTAHPNALTLMNEDWFWDAVDDLSPFGNDDGHDAFYTFKEWRENNKISEPVIFIDILEERWQMSFAHINIDDEKELPSIEKANTFYRNIDRAVIGIAFGQLVLEGKISPKLKTLGLKVIKRTNTSFGMNGMSEENMAEYKLRLKKMEDILNKF